MTLPRKQIPTAEEAERQLIHKLRMVTDAISRIGDNVGDGHVSPASCAYIDGQLARAIGWLASCRSIVITQGELADPRFDSEGVWDLDDEIVIAKSVRLIERSGGSSHE